MSDARDRARTRTGGAVRIALLACTLAAIGCEGRENEADEAARAALTVDAGTPRTAPAVAPMPDAAGIAPPRPERAVPVGQWWSQRGPDGPAAAWGVPNSETVLHFACDRASGDVVVQRDAVGVPAEIGVLTLDADGLRRGLPAAREVTALGPRLVARVPVDDPLLDRLQTATTLRVVAGDDVLVTAAPGAALARVREACRPVSPSPR